MLKSGEGAVVMQEQDRRQEMGVGDISGWAAALAEEGGEHPQALLNEGGIVTWALREIANELIPDAGPSFSFGWCDLRWVAYDIARLNGREQPNDDDKIQAVVEVFAGLRSVEDGTCKEWPWEEG